ncbi:MAG: eight-cysteine-cluster domain-containing protein [Candidatus Aenigmatarchaeota archaeon]
MERLVTVIIALLVLTQLTLALEPFCGWSTYGSCSKDSDCQAGGCSGQVCERLGEGTITTCEFKECYVAENYNLTCQCISNKCQWGYSNKTAFAEQESRISKIKGMFFSIIAPNPILLLVFGVILVLLAKLAKFVGIVLIILGLIGLILWFI